MADLCSEVTILSPSAPENKTEEIGIAPIESSPSLYDTIYKSFKENEPADSVILTPTSSCGESLGDILQCLGADDDLIDSFGSQHVLPELSFDYL